jgi:hypothetical protein
LKSAARTSTKLSISSARSLFLLLLVPLALAEATNAQLPPGTCWEYRGTLGENTKIGMSLFGGGTELTGSYFYFRHQVDIPLTGSYSGARDITLIEKQSDGTPRATFTLHDVEHDPRFSSKVPLQGEILQGTWASSDGKKSLLVFLQMATNCPKPGDRWYPIAGDTDDQTVEQNAKAFYEAILHGNRTEAAKYVSYPCTYIRNGKRLSLKESAEFLQQYEQIFSPAFVAEIAKDVPHHMFSNWQGIMIADGAVWFDAQGKAKHLNNTK